MAVPRTVFKFGRDLAVMLALSAVLYLAENAKDIGLPESVVPIVSAMAMLLYRSVRDVTAKVPPA